MFWLRQILYFAFQTWGRRFVADRIKKKSYLMYLKSIQVFRKSLIGAITFLCVLQLMVMGATGAFVTGILLTNLEVQTKLWILFGGFLTLLVIPMGFLTFWLSESFWFKASGAEKFFEGEQIQKSQPAEPAGVWQTT